MTVRIGSEAMKKTDNQPEREETTIEEEKSVPERENGSQKHK